MDVVFPKIRFLAAVPLPAGSPALELFQSWLRDWYTGDPFDRVMESKVHYDQFRGDHIEVVVTAPMANPTKEYFVADEVHHLDGHILVIWQPKEE